MADSPDLHYTAVIEITKVERLGRTAAASPGTKEKVEVARIIVRSDSIASLIAKSQAHLNLIED